MNHAAIRPVSPPAGYIGGKRALAKVLTPMIAATPHEIYGEPFLGMGGVFLRRTSKPPVEAVNDFSRDVATLFRVLQRHYEAFTDMLKWQVASRADYERLAACNPETLTDLERAARFLFLQRMSFGGKVAGRSFGISTSHPARFDPTRLAPILEAIHERLAGVYIECLPWRAFLARWDRPQALFFIDPPYWGSENDYGAGLFSRSDYGELAEVLCQLKGRLILTLNDVPDIRDLFRWAKIEPVRLNYTVSGKPTEAREIIITGGAG